MVEYWSKTVFKRPPNEFILGGNLETGINIEISGFKPFDVINRYQSFGRTTVNEFCTCEPYGRSAKPIQRICFMSDYRIKTYDKSKQANLAKAGTLRFEIVFSQLRKIRTVLGFPSNTAITLETLNSIEIWCKLFDFIQTVYDSIKKLPLLIQPLGESEINSIHEYCNVQFSKDVGRIMNLNTFKKRRAEKKKLYSKFDQSKDNFHLILRDQMINKFISLIN